MYITKDFVQMVVPSYQYLNKVTIVEYDPFSAFKRKHAPKS